jgi:hypothetical protein
MFQKRYVIYRRLLYVCMFANAALIMLGIVAAMRFLQEGQLRSLELMIIGGGVLIFGFALPFYLSRKIARMAQAWESDIKKLIADWLSIWAESRENHQSNEGVLTDMSFWLNLVIITLQSLRGRISNPYLQFFTEMAGFVREALHEAHSTNTQPKRRSARAKKKQDHGAAGASEKKQN